MPEHDWADALRRERAGDASGYEPFLRAYASWLRRVVRRRLADLGIDPREAEDIVQDVLMSVHARRDQWDEGRPLLPWLAAIARYRIIDALRRRRSERRVRIDLSDREWHALFEEARAPDATDRSGVERMVATLPPVEQAVVRRVGMEGLSAKEAARATGMREGAVRVAFHRGLARLMNHARRNQD